MVVSVARVARDQQSRFFVWLAAFFVAVTFLAFSPTYFVPLAYGRFESSWALHVHGALFFGWTLLFLTQSALVANRRIRWHRQLGYVGVALAIVMVLTGLLALSSSLALRTAQGFEAQGRALTTVPFAGLVLFAGFFTAAVLNLRRPDFHKRLMVLATLSILQGASGRIAFYFAVGRSTPFAHPSLFPPAPPALAAVPHLAFDALVLGALYLYDRRTLGRAHPVLLYGGGCLVVAQVLRPLVADTAAWRAVTDLLLAIGV